MRSREQHAMVWELALPPWLLMTGCEVAVCTCLFVVGFGTSLPSLEKSVAPRTTLMICTVHNNGYTNSAHTAHHTIRESTSEFLRFVPQAGSCCRAQKVERRKILRHLLLSLFCVCRAKRDHCWNRALAGFCCICCRERDLQLCG